MFSKYLCKLRAHLADNHSVKFRRFSWIFTGERTGTQSVGSLFKKNYIVHFFFVWPFFFLSKKQAFGLTYLLYLSDTFIQILYSVFYILRQWTLVESVQLNDNISIFDRCSMTDVTNLMAVLPKSIYPWFPPFNFKLLKTTLNIRGYENA